MQTRSVALPAVFGLGLLGLLLHAKAASAQTAPSPLSLHECIQLALASHSSVVVARTQADIASLGVSQAQAALRPQARLAGAFTYNSPLAADTSLPSFVALNGVREYLTVASATQELDTSGRLRASRARAEADRATAEASLGIAERDLKRQVAGAYYRALLTRHLAAASRDAQAESAAFEARTKLLFDEGEAARADVVKAASQTAFLSQSVMAADLDAEVARHELLSFWTSDVDAPITLEDSLDEPPPAPPSPSPDDAAPFLRRPEFGLLDAQRDGFLAASKRARAERRPQANLMLQYGIDSLRLDSHDRGWAAFVTLDVPVFDWSAGKNASRQFQLQAEQVEATRKGNERAFARDYQDAVSRARLTHAQIETTRTQVTLSEENLRLSRIRYDGGEGPALDVVAAQAQLAQARANLYTAHARYLESRADLELAAGR
ncbi:MAG TPA: TolC family protein [Vicinamibacteria bacterium]|nr:TolC family protein [Vicinamibacteria bacterium]